MFAALIISIALALLAVPENPNSGVKDYTITAESAESAITDTIRTASIISEAKQQTAAEDIPAMTTTIFLNDLRQRAMETPRAFSASVPNLLIPDYGSAMTSTVYMRGFGSRIDNPVIGLYIDDIPVLDKNAYDFDFLDIRRADFLSGPQGTLYGRNSMTGLMSLGTLAPGDYEGIGGSISYGTAGELKAKAGWYGERASAVLGFGRGNGYYTNDYDGSKIDPYNTLSGRFRLKVRDGMENILSFSLLDQGGYPYARIGDGKVLPVSYNRYCGYKRATVTDGFKIRREMGYYVLHSISSLQLLFDRMDMDQDFTTDDMFTLRQSQREYGATQELILRPKTHIPWWNWQSGAFLYYRYLDMSAPVTFMHDGIDRLILANANENIPEQFGKLDFLEDNFVIYSDFGIHTYNAALYHESYFSFGRWNVTAGLRIDYEGGTMNYDSHSLVNYSLVGFMKKYLPLETRFEGTEHNSNWEIVPKLAATYDFPMRDGLTLKGFGNFSKGFKAGGFNTQLFSDILRNRMMIGMMRDMGIYLEGQDYMDAGGTTYKPEDSYNLEAGFKGSMEKGGHSLNLSASVFYIACRNQQLTAFPPGKSQGRYMRNAGRSHSAGAEVAASYRYKGLDISASYGTANARFDRYNDGKNDYAGKHIPYSPEQTLYIHAGYTIGFQSSYLRSITIGASCNGTGPTWWDDANEFRQDFYSLLGDRKSVV